MSLENSIYWLKRYLKDLESEKEYCCVCGELNEPEATECAHCGARIIDIGDIDLLGKPVVFKMRLENNITAIQAYLPRLETELDTLGIIFRTRRTVTFDPIYTEVHDETMVMK